MEKLLFCFFVVSSLVFIASCNHGTPELKPGECKWVCDYGDYTVILPKGKIPDLSLTCEPQGLDHNDMKQYHVFQGGYNKPICSKE